MLADGLPALGKPSAAASALDSSGTPARKASGGRPSRECERPGPRPGRHAHTSNSFALAAVAERHYGWTLGVPAYLPASLVGALGYIVGRTVVRVNSRPMCGGSARGAGMHLAPIVARHTRGVRLSVVL